MENEIVHIKISTLLKMVLYFITSWLPLSRRKFDRQRLQFLEIFNAQRELQMMTRRDIMILANKMIQFHGIDLMKEQDTTTINPMKSVEKVKDNTENMYR